MVGEEVAGLFGVMTGSGSGGRHYSLLLRSRTGQPCIANLSWAQVIKARGPLQWCQG